MTEQDTSTIDGWLAEGMVRCEARIRTGAMFGEAWQHAALAKWELVATTGGLDGVPWCRHCHQSFKTPNAAHLHEAWVMMAWQRKHQLFIPWARREEALIIADALIQACSMLAEVMKKRRATCGAAVVIDGVEIGSVDVSMVLPDVADVNKFYQSCERGRQIHLASSPRPDATPQLESALVKHRERVMKIWERSLATLPPRIS